MSLSQIQSLRIAAVLEDCCHQLEILGHSLTVLIRAEQDMAAVQEENTLIKMKRECQSISQLVSELHFEMEERQSFSSLLRAVEEDYNKQKEEERKRETEFRLEQKRQTLLRQQQDVQDKKEKLNEMCCLLERLKESSQRQRAKLQLMQTETQQPDDGLDDQLELQRKYQTEEKRAHEESVKLQQNQHQELQQLLDKWRQRTQQMLLEKQTQLDDLSCKKTLSSDRLVEMRRTFREIEQVVTEDKKEQEKLRQQELEARAATKLQAWWRGRMVQRGLGAFRKAESKKGKKKKGKKKK